MEQEDGQCRSCAVWSSVLLLPIRWGEEHCLAAEKGYSETQITDSWSLTNPAAGISDVIMLEHLSCPGKVDLC